MFHWLEIIECIFTIKFINKNNSKNKILFFQQWELLVLSLLKWELSTVTPLDFVQLLLSRLPLKTKRCSDINEDKVRRHAQAFISLAARGKSIFYS